MAQVKKYRSLRDAFGQFATGVTVVTTVSNEGKPVGITANSFSSVSLEPPLVSWSIDSQAQRYQEFSQAEHFTISVLNQTQQDISDLFAQRSWDDSIFNETQWYADDRGIPQIPNAVARYHCKTINCYEGGDHLIILAQVLDYESDPQPPLIFCQGNYGRLA